jgi:hypothetical protein
MECLNVESVKCVSRYNVFDIYIFMNDRKMFMINIGGFFTLLVGLKVNTERTKYVLLFCHQNAR